MAANPQGQPHILLTGAGFANAVNACLTMQIWEHAFNQLEVTGDEVLRKEMLNNGQGDHANPHTSLSR
ncbi:MAG: hypothetical protein A3J74_05550 [Elusimicrobia bacterium RIFCSPHIGHO2_02_FULL_57_9]|nr:MAG: hypothetical protein A3J74_05550 [Elusimicrobia bacterium RIFCSPHIGHO2_02_FULL_57_9]